MAAAFLWGGIGVLLLFLVIGFVAGLIRGLKRSALHIIFFVVGFVIAFFITKPITSAILGISIVVDGTSTTLNNIVYTFLSKQFEGLKDFTAVGDFAKTLPLSVASPIVFIVVALVTYFLFDIIYLIVARLCFGKKKQDFSENNPLRWFGSGVGLFEGFLFMFLLFAPLASLTQTFQSLATYDSAPATSTSVVAMQDENSPSTLPLLSELIEENVPSIVNDITKEFSNSVLGKVAGAGGLNHAMFDYLSSAKVKNETIHLRKDLLALADTYNEFAIAYNEFNAEDYDKIDLTALKKNLERFLNEGIFKGVIAPTVKDFVVNFDVATAPDFVKGNELISDLITELKTKFSEEGFSAKKYLKDDLLKIVDIADAAFDTGLVEEFTNLQSGDMMEILKTISQNSDKMETVLEELSELHIISDGFDVIGNYASKKMGELLGDEDIKLNLDSFDKVALITNTFDALNNALEATKALDFDKILDGDLMGGIADVENIDQVLINIGKAFDGIRTLDILVHPAEEEDGKKTYVLDQILESYNFSLLGGDTIKDVIVEKEDGTQETKDIKIDSYENFCLAIARPVKLAQELDLFHIGTTGSNFEEILGNVLDKMHELSQSETNAQAQSTDETPKSELLSQILLPFYQLQNEKLFNEGEQISVRNLIFDNIIESLDDGVDQIDLTGVADTYDAWKTTLDDLGGTLLLLDDKTEEHMIVVGEEKYTYIRYILTDKSDFKVLLDNVVEDGTLKNILKSLLKSSVFDNLVDQIFDQLDSAINDLTKVAPQKMENRKELIKGKEEQIAETFGELLDFANNTTDINNINLADIGALLDRLKDNAKHEVSDGEFEDGIFKGVFENLIWYLTGDASINPTLYGSQETTFADASKVKDFLKTGEGATDYYAIHYADEFAKIDEAWDFLQVLDEKGLRTFQFGDVQDAQEKAEEFIGKFNEVLANFGTDEDKTRVLNETKDMIDKVAGEQKFLDGVNDDVKQVLKEAIRTEFNGETEETDTELTTAILNLLGLSDAA